MVPVPRHARCLAGLLAARNAAQRLEQLALSEQRGWVGKAGNAATAKGNPMAMFRAEAGKGEELPIPWISPFFLLVPSAASLTLPLPAGLPRSGCAGHISPRSSWSDSSIVTHDSCIVAHDAFTVAHDARTGHISPRSSWSDSEIVIHDAGIIAHDAFTVAHDARTVTLDTRILFPPLRICDPTINHLYHPPHDSSSTLPDMAGWSPAQTTISGPNNLHPELIIICPNHQPA